MEKVEAVRNSLSKVQLKRPASDTCKPANSSSFDEQPGPPKKKREKITWP